jgi:hypothetical protein
MGKRELSHRKKLKNNKYTKKSKFNAKGENEGFISEKSNYNDKPSIPKSVPYEAFVSKFKETNKYLKSLEYLSLFVSNKSEWKFNVNI